MKTRILIYTIFGVICAVCIGIYFIDPSLPFFQVTMSFGASLIGAIFVAVTIESISNSKQKRSVKVIQKHLLSSIRQNFKSFYLWLGNYLVRKFNIVDFDCSQIKSSTELYSKIYAECNRKIKENLVDLNLENLVEYVAGRLNPLIDSIEKLNNIIDAEIATLITNEVIGEDDVALLNSLKMHLLSAEESENFEELTSELDEVMTTLNSQPILSLDVKDLLTERLVRKFSMPSNE